MGPRPILLVGCLLLSGCGNSQPPTPSPPGSGSETITGRERIGWDQPAASSAELATFRYAIYVDNVRSEVADVTCASTAGPNGYACSGRLPAMANGTHVLELASFILAGTVLEGPRSQRLTVTVTGLAAPAAAALTDGNVITTADGVRLQVDVLFEGLHEPSALTVAPNGRTLIGTADGILIVQDGKAAGPPQLSDGAALAIGLSPEFERDGYVFVTQAIPTASAGTIFRTSRVRDMGGWLADRMVILEHGPAAAEPSAALRFGADAKLHLAYDDGGNPEAAERMSEWRGKLLRMEADGRTPSDQAAASPVMWRGLTSPRGFDWPADGAALWLADASRDGVERLRVIVSAGTPRRSSQAASYVLPKGTNATALAFHRGAGIDEFAGNLFVSGRSGSLLRIRFSARDQRPSATEKLLEGGVGALRAMTIAADGSIYVCDDTRLIRLRRPPD